MENELRSLLFTWKEELMEKKVALLEMQNDTDMYAELHEMVLASLKDADAQKEKIDGYLGKIKMEDDPFSID